MNDHAMLNAQGLGIVTKSRSRMQHSDSSRSQPQQMLLDLLGSVLLMSAVATAMVVAPEGSDLKGDHCNGQDNRGGHRTERHCGHSIAATV